jgi:hypothetical protein
MPLERLTSGVQDPATRAALLRLDEYVLAGDALKVSKSGDTMTGMLTLPSTTPTNANHATRKGYVDAQDALKVSKSGDTMTGSLSIQGNLSFTGSLTAGTVPWARLSGVPSSLSNTVNLSGNQTIAGNKTFTGRWRSESTSGAWVGADEGFGARLIWFNPTDNNEWGLFHRNNEDFEVVRNGGWRARFESNGNFRFTGTLQQGTVPWARLSGQPTITAGDGLTGGGQLTGSRTISLGTPGNLNGGTLNGVTSSGHTHSISSTTSRTNTSTTTLLAAAAMNNHRTSGDHDSRYVNISGGGSVTGQLVATQNGNSTTWSDNALVSRSSGTRGGVGMEQGSNRLQFRTANNIVYLRSAGDAVFRAFHAIISNQSSRTLKQDIETWSLKASNAGAMLNDSIAWSATDVVKKLRPVTYRWEEETWFDNDLGSERREKARWRLHKYQKKKGLPLYSSDETVHMCGRNCDGSPEEPCSFYANWARGELGFIAEEVGDVIPQVTSIDAETGENTAIDHLGLIAVLTKAVQELTDRVEQLEALVSSEGQ